MYCKTSHTILLARSCDADRHQTWLLLDSIPPTSVAKTPQFVPRATLIAISAISGAIYIDIQATGTNMTETNAPQGHKSVPWKRVL